MIDIKNKKAVFFDFGDTLASTVPTYPDRIRIALNALGYEFTEKQYFSAFQFADYQIYKNYINDKKVSSKIYQKTLFSVLTEELGINTDSEELRNKVNQKMSGAELKRELLPGAGELLNYLSSCGYKLSVISNNDGRTAEKCEDVGIAEYMELIIDSTKVNIIKPDSRIFLLASEMLQIDPKDILHIGDLYGADVLGAMNAGIDVIWINHKSGKNYEGLDLVEVNNLPELLNIFKKR